MFWLKFLISFAALLVSTEVAAQCGNVADGDVDPTNRCQLCHDGAFESLPPRTSCDDERRVQCDANGAYRVECVLAPTANDPEFTECKSEYRWPDGCPSGFACDAGFCLQSCATTADCRANFACRGDVCVAVDAPDMGGDMSTSDMGSDMSTADMNPPADMGSDMSTPDMAQADVSNGADATVDSGPSVTRPKDDGGCCAVIATGSTNSWVGLLALAALWMWRRRE